LAQKNIVKSLANPGTPPELVQKVETAIKVDESTFCGGPPTGALPVRSDDANCTADFRGGITFKSVKLSPSGQQGLIVMVSRPYRIWCDPATTSGGRCAVFILKDDGVAYKSVLGQYGDSGSLESLTLSNTVTDGFYDIAGKNLHYACPTHCKLVWNGSKYESKEGIQERTKQYEMEARLHESEGKALQLANELTEIYSKSLLSHGADPYRTFLKVHPQILGSILGLVIETNALGLPGNVEEFLKNCSWIPQAYSLGVKGIRLTNGQTTCDVQIVDSTTISPGMCFAQWWNGEYMQQKVVRQWPQGYTFKVGR
jgi:hypothetical protein